MNKAEVGHNDFQKEELGSGALADSLFWHDCYSRAGQIVLFVLKGLQGGRGGG